MKHRKLLRRAAGLFLIGALALGGLRPTLIAKAEDFVIDDSGFKDPTVSHQTVYIWREGPPTIDSIDDIGKKRDILISWTGQEMFSSTTDQYCLRTGSGFVDTAWYHYSRNNGNDVKWGFSIKDMPEKNGKNNADEIKYNNGIYKDSDWEKYAPGYPHAAYRYEVWYGGKLTANLPFNFSALVESGITATFDHVDNLPFAANYGKDDAGNELFGFGVHPGPFTNGLSGSWLFGKTNMYSWNEDYSLGSDEQRTYIWCNFDWSTADMEPEDDYLWTIKRDGSGYRFENKGTSEWEITGYADNEDDGDLKNIAANLFRWHGFGHERNYLKTVDNARMRTFGMGGSENNLSPHLSGDQGVFKVYWCEPVIMDFLQTDFTVENGQVTNLDGPIALVNSTITVKEGGTLTITNWVANNGTIRVEKGGTLYLQDDSCLCRLNDGGHTGGGIICEGLIIVGRNAKLCGGGVDGIQLYNGSHVVNYGAVISENFKVATSHTIENRSGGKVFYGEGNGIIGSGMGTWYNPVTDSGFCERGKVEPTCSVDMAWGAIYTY